VRAEREVFVVPQSTGQQVRDTGRSRRNKAHCGRAPRGNPGRSIAMTSPKLCFRLAGRRLASSHAASVAIGKPWLATWWEARPWL
jgi:hypothetical protein